jgi:hypothetical protein
VKRWFFLGAIVCGCGSSNGASNATHDETGHGGGSDESGDTTSETGADGESGEPSDTEEGDTGEVDHCPPAWIAALPGHPTSVDVGPNGEVVVAGYYFTWTAPTHPFDGDPGLFVASFEDDGTPRWMHGFATHVVNTQINVAATPSGDVVIVGLHGFDGIDVGRQLPPSDLGYVRFIASFDTDGAHRWSSAFGGGGSYFTDEVRVASDGRIVLAGSFGAPLDFGGLQLLPQADTDSYLAVMTENGEPLQAWTLGGFVRSMALTNDDEVLIAAQQGGPHPIAIARLTLDGSFLWKADFGGDATNDRATSVASDPASNGVAFAGFLGITPFRTNLDPSFTEAFWARVDANGGLEASSNLDPIRTVGSGQRERSLTVDGRGHSYVVGRPYAGDEGGRTSSLLQLDPEARLVREIPFTGPDDDDLTAVAAHPCGSAVVTGWTREGGMFDGVPVDAGGMVRLLGTAP